MFAELYSLMEGLKTIKFFSVNMQLLFKNSIFQKIYPKIIFLRNFAEFNFVILKSNLEKWFYKVLNTPSAPHFTNPFCHEFSILGCLKFYIASYFNMN